MDALGDYFFFTWKVSVFLSVPFCIRLQNHAYRATPQIGQSNTSTIDYPLWSYQLGHQHGWIPNDPRQASGACERLPGGTQPLTSTTAIATWAGTYQPANTGASGTAAFPTGDARYPWPPTSLHLGPGRTASVSQSLPTYTSTGTPIVLPGPTYTIKNSQQNTVKITSTDDYSAIPSKPKVEPIPAPTFVAGCNYPDPWDAYNLGSFTQVCGGTYTDFRTITRSTDPPAPAPTSSF